MVCPVFPCSFAEFKKLGFSNIAPNSLIRARSQNVVAKKSEYHYKYFVKLKFSEVLKTGQKLVSIHILPFKQNVLRVIRLSRIFLIQGFRNFHLKKAKNSMRVQLFANLSYYTG